MVYSTANVWSICRVLTPIGDDDQSRVLIMWRTHVTYYCCLYQSHLPARYGIQPWFDGSLTGTARNLWRQGIGGNKEEPPLGEPSIHEMSPCHRIGIASFRMSQTKLSMHNFFQGITIGTTQNNTVVFAVLMILCGNKTSLVQQPYVPVHPPTLNGGWKQNLQKVHVHPYEDCFMFVP